jgi:hypothetical protein
VQTTVGGRESEFGGIVTRCRGLTDDPVVVVKCFIHGNLNGEVGGRLEGVGLRIICFGLVGAWWIREYDPSQTKRGVSHTDNHCVLGQFFIETFRRRAVQVEVEGRRLGE